MKAFEASFETIVIRFYTMMAVIIIPILMGYPLLALLAVPVFLSAILGISFKSDKKTKTYNEKMLRIKNEIKRTEPYKKAS